MSAKKTVLITGCSQGGVGEALCRVFHEKGWYVFATLRNPAKAGSLAQLEHLEVLPLEVTSAESIQAAADAVAKRTGGSLDVLVNNAGQDFVTPLLDVNLDEAKRLYDVNVWSIVGVTQVFAPMLIKSKGTICNVSSTAACMPFAYAGIYQSSKIASQRISEVMRIEMAPLGVTVTTGMLGAVATPIHDNAGALNLPAGSYYTAVKETISKQRQGEHKPGAEKPEVTARNMYNDIIRGKAVIWRGGFAGLIKFLQAWMPSVLIHIVNNDKDLKVLEKAHQQGR
ncbi:oxidoreductase [Apiospora marii]|uniref:Oxidoreductase n=1 Tax=Apiospora marii TaxID=335849 RepID=A0ABR1SGR2_9PEZI